MTKILAIKLLCIKMPYLRVTFLSTLITRTISYEKPLRIWSFVKKAFILVQMRKFAEQNAFSHTRVRVLGSAWTGNRASFLA